MVTSRKNHNGEPLMIEKHNLSQAESEEQQLDTEIYSLGWFDGITNTKPAQKLLANNDYWLGYALGNREHWAKQYQVSLAA